MSSVDAIFKKPALPGTKRRSEAARDPTEINKSVKLSSNGHAKRHGNQAAVEAVVDEDDIDADPAPPPDDEDYGPDIVDDDEEGRFFGGGITSNEAEILDYMDGQEDANVAPETIDIPWLRKLSLNFEKRISKNAELRAKFENDPTKFMGSEADLDADIKGLSILAEYPHLYPEFAKLGCAGSLVGLLAHENTDIAIDAIEIIAELTDENVSAEQEQWDALVDVMVEADLLDLLSSNFSRFDESNESDQSGVYHALSVLENLASQGSLAEKICQDTPVMKYLLARASKKESPVTQNKQYAAEVLAILLQQSSMNRRKLAELDGVDLLLQILAPYRKRDPEKGTEEEEFVENIFDCLICAVDESDGKQKFVEAEGLELCLIMIKEGKMARTRALRVVDHALSGLKGGEVAAKLVDAGGLKTIFTVFMKKQDNQITEHLLGIFSALLRSLPAESPGRIRTLAKFVEKDYEKIAKLVKLRRDYAARVANVDDEARAGLSPGYSGPMSDEWLGRRFDAGFFCLQTIDVIMAWLVAEDEGASQKIRELLAERDEGLGLLKGTLQEQLDTMADAENEEEEINRDMLKTLIQFLS